MSNAIHGRKNRPTVKAWVSKPGAEIETQSITNLQEAFGHRLNVQRGNAGETIIASQPQDAEHLAVIMQRGESPFVERPIHGDITEA